ncbi:MAG: Unknown protein [uncultured Sulfurovum sp.]|uniref:DUF4178 domain-containing protein n=1 Tax=uncultured Sulfurovum sp. TaxID=269237 RepID=A0A6S6SEA2_9BACT|nr:MAG: Unknown protein [uncultured Sulfurovum sp.]
MSSKFTIEKSIQCPQCGDSLPLYFKHTKLVQCNSCTSTIFLENESTRLAGESSVLTPELSILSLNAPFIYDHKSYLPLGKIRYSYGRGFWEEWWIKDLQNNEYWISIDEGDLVLQQKTQMHYDNDIVEHLAIGDVLHDEWIVSEIGTATYEGFEGALPKLINIGSSYTYVHLSGKDAKLLTLEYSQNIIEGYEGRWISPFDIGRIH